MTPPPQPQLSGRTASRAQARRTFSKQKVAEWSKTLQSGPPSLVGPNVMLLSALLKTLRSDPESRVRGCEDDLVAVIIRLQRQRAEWAPTTHHEER